MENLISKRIELSFVWLWVAVTITLVGIYLGGVL